MLFRTLSAAVYGINADLVDIEVNLTPVRSESDKEPPVTIVGLPDAAVRESRERIRAAIHQIAGSGLTLSKLSVAASLLGDLARH